MAGIAVLKDNTRLFIKTTDEATFLASHKMGNITEIGDLASEAEEIDTTTIDSLAKEFTAGFDDNGSLEITQNITENEYTTMKTYKDNNEELDFAISAFSKGRQVIGVQGHGIIMSLTLTGISVGGLLQVSTSIRISGSVTMGFVDPIGPSVGIPVSSITVSGMGGVSTISTKGGTLQVVSEVAPPNATNKAVTYSMKADSTAFADVSPSGLVTAKSDGVATVVATAKDGSMVTGELRITITGQTE